MLLIKCSLFEFYNIIYISSMFTWLCLYLVRNVMAHAQKPDFVFPRNGRVHLNRWGRQFSRLLAAEVCASAWVMLETPRSEAAWEYWLPTPFASFPFRVPPRSERSLHLDIPVMMLCVCWGVEYSPPQHTARDFSILIGLKPNLMSAYLPQFLIIQQCCACPPQFLIIWQWCACPPQFLII